MQPEDRSKVCGDQSGTAEHDENKAEDMERDNQIIAILRRVASGQRVSARKRLDAIDALAALDSVYFTMPTHEQYKQAPARSRTMIYRLLKSLLNGKEQIRGKVGDRLRFMRGYNVAGLYRAIGDPLNPNAPTREANPAEQFVQKYLGGN
jgi:hypothetical protein